MAAEILWWKKKKSNAYKDKKYTQVQCLAH